MVPADLRETLRLLEPRLKQVRDYLQGRLRVEIDSPRPVTIEARLKEGPSVYQKLQTGKYASVLDLHDLVGLKVVMLRKSQIPGAIGAILASSLQLVESNLSVAVEPTTFAYHQPHLIVELPRDFIERNQGLAGIRAEIQVTTTLQHALDMATHDFDYKGKSFAASNFRLVAQLRGSLELIDNIIDDIETSARLGHSSSPSPIELQEAQLVLDMLIEVFGSDALPEDQRRLALAARAMLTAASVSLDDFGHMMERHQDLVDALSLDPLDAIVGVLMREKPDDFLNSYPYLLSVPYELQTLCEETASISPNKRVRLGGDGAI